MIKFCGVSILSNGFYEFKRGLRQPKISEIETVNSGTVVQIAPLPTVYSHELQITEIQALNDWDGFFGKIDGLLNLTGDLEISDLNLTFPNCTIKSVSTDDLKTVKVNIGGATCFMQHISLTFLQQV